MPHTSDGVGYRRRDTSKAAAEAVRAKPMREIVFDVIASAPVPLSPDDVADILGKGVLSIRPRVTELAKAGRIEDSGRRGLTDDGRRCIRWQVAS